MALDPIEEIKTRFDIVDIIKEYIPLQNAGANFRARCPFHQEKSASFMVSASKQIWHCFGCGEGGDLFTFVMKHESLQFGEALRLLAQKAGIQLESQDPRLKDEKSRLYDCMSAAVDFFHLGFLKSPRALHAREYAAKRGLSEDIIDEFKIGYAPGDENLLYQYLLGKKFLASEMLNCGLVLKRAQGYQYYDRFRNRLIVPIRNLHGAVVGFGGRLLEEIKDAPKYLNSPQTALYDKSRIVFGLDKAKYEIRKTDEVILVEGYMDFLALYQAGIKHVVATSGTALTVEQIRLIKRFTSTLLFCFDSDAAGSQATVRGIEHALSEGMNVRIIELPRTEDGVSKYKDPDDCIRASKDDWAQAVKDARSFVQFHFDRTMNTTVITDGYAKRKAVHHMLGIIRLLAERVEQDHWIKKLAQELFLSESVLWEELTKGAKQATQKISPAPQKVAQPKEQGQSIQMLFLSFCIRFPSMCQEVMNDIDNEMIDHELDKMVYEQFKNNQEPSGKECEERYNLLSLLAEKEYEFLSEKNALEIGLQLADKIRDEYRKRKIDELQTLMADAERTNNSEAVQRYTQEFSKLKH